MGVIGMGSWNGTCGLTQLPIQQGDKVALFVLKRDRFPSTSGGGFVYSYNQYSPICVPIFGEYDDYGGIENIYKNEEVAYVHLMYLLEDGKMPYNQKELERQKSIGPITDKKPQNLKQFINDFIERGVFEGIGFMMVHESVYQDVLKEMNSRKPYGRTVTKKQLLMEDLNKYLDESKRKQRLLQEAKEQLCLLKEKEERNPEEEKVYQQLDDVVFKAEMHDFGRHGDFNNRMVGFYHSYDGHFELLQNLLHMAVFHDDHDYHESLIDLIMFNHVMNFMRKMWTPQVGTGSGSKEYHLHKVLAYSIIEFEKEKFDQLNREHHYTEEEKQSLTKEEFWD